MAVAASQTPEGHLRAALEPRERFARVGEIELCYEDLGDPDGEPMLLVMGLGTQLIHWHPGFCNMLIDRGFRVIRFDNRDSGHSTAIESPPPATVPMLFGLRRGRAYNLDDMAADAVGLLDALEIESAHLTGVSMGGMIAQVAGYRHPDRVCSLALLMTGSGSRASAMPRPRALRTLVAKPAEGREAFIELAVRTFAVIGSPAYPMDAAREAEFRQTVGLGWDRGHSAAGFARQLHAINATGDRRRLLRGVRAPTVVIHGDKDPLVRPAAGRSLARAIPGAAFRLIPGMGHDMPQELFQELVETIATNAARAPAASAA